MSTAVNAVEMARSAEEIRERVRAAGVVGAGGAGFPAHVKLQAQVEIFLVNAAECEPMLKVDQQLMWQQAARPSPRCCLPVFACIFCRMSIPQAMRC